VSPVGITYVSGVLAAVAARTGDANASVSEVTVPESAGAVFIDVVDVSEDGDEVRRTRLVALVGEACETSTVGLVEGGGVWRREVLATAWVQLGSGVPE
jgi:hypothetical protein